MGPTGYYGHTFWTAEEIATWDDPEPDPETETLSLGGLRLVVNNGITPILD